MRLKFISRIRANVSNREALHSKRATANVLDGSYKSVFKGRSMNFDELREYVPGDDIKDVDWKASARNRKLFIREYVAEKKHNLMLVLDTNARMLADSKGLDEKRDLAIMSAGTMAYFVEKHGDFVGATYATATSIDHFPLKTGLDNIELILESYFREVTEDNHSDLNATLDFIVKNVRRRMILLIVTDLEGALKISPQNIKRLLVAHDIILINISDAEFAYDNMYLMGGESYMPEFFATDKKVRERAAANRLSAMQSLTYKMKQYGILFTSIDSLDEIERKLLALLDRNKHENS